MPVSAASAAHNPVGAMPGLTKPTHAFPTRAGSGDLNSFSPRDPRESGCHQCNLQQERSGETILAATGKLATEPVGMDCPDQTPRLRPQAGFHAGPMMQAVTASWNWRATKTFAGTSVVKRIHILRRNLRIGGNRWAESPVLTAGRLVEERFRPSGCPKRMPFVRGAVALTLADVCPAWELKRGAASDATSSRYRDRESSQRISD